MHTIFHAILRTISIQSPDHDTQALERAPVFCCARVFFDAVRAALPVAIEAGQTRALILRHPPLRNELQGPQVAPNSLTADLTPTCHSIHLTAPTMVPLSLLKAVGYLAAWCVVIAECQPWEATHIMYIATDEQKRKTYYNKKLASWNRLNSSPHALQTKVDN